MSNRILLGKLFLPALMLLYIVPCSYCQEFIPADSILFKPGKVDMPLRFPGLLEMAGYETSASLPVPELNARRPVAKIKAGFYPDFYVDQTPLHKGDYNVSGIIHATGSGAIYGLGSQENVIGIEKNNYAAVGYLHQFGDRLSVNVQLNANKLTTPYLRSQSFGTSGRVSYRLNNRLMLNAFGSYSVMPAHSFKMYELGGSLNAQISERFGTEIGVRRLYDSTTRRWETIPIITPYYKFDKFTLGADIGGLLKYFIQDKVKIRRGDFTSPTIRAPIP